MKFGLFVNGQHPPGESMVPKIQESLEQVKAARECGFHMICAGQHYLSAPYHMNATIPFLARLAAEADGMDIAATVLLLPLLNPVDVAETAATMDAISGGHFILGIGIGYRDEEYIAFGIKRNERIARTAEALEIIHRLWTEGEVEHHGQFYNVPKVFPTTRPIQKPYPPIWMAANGKAAITRAARWGYPWVINPHATVNMVKQQLETYTKEAEKVGQPKPTVIPMMRELYISEDSHTAYSESRPYLESKYAAYSSWGQDKALPEGTTFSVPFDELARDRFFIGSPEEIVEQITQCRDNLGINYLLLRIQWPGMPHQKAMKQLELLGKEVLPRLQ